MRGKQIGWFARGSGMFEEFRKLSPKGKAMAVGTVALVALSIGLACFNYSGRLTGEDPFQIAGVESEEEGLIAANAEPIPLATPKTQLATGLMELLANESCAWIAEDDPLRALGFTEDGFTAYNGDIATECEVTFYEIAATENGRSGVWRVAYPDGTAKDARFTFTEDLAAGEYVISSCAFPDSHQTYRTRSLGTGMLD